MRPTPHARKRPNITISMLEALKLAADKHAAGGAGQVLEDRGVVKALVRRGLASWSDPEERHAVITEAGRLLIQTQYEALKQVLPETRQMYLA